MTTYAYNDDEQKATTVDPRGNVSGGNPAAYPTTFGYDPARNLVKVTDPLGGVGDDRRNLGPLSAAVNSPIMSGYESQVADAIGAGQTVCTL